MSLIEHRSKTADDEPPDAAAAAAAAQTGRPPTQRVAPAFRRVITGLSHGGHAVSAQQEPAPPPGTTTVGAATAGPEPLHVDDISSPFDYLFGGLRDDYPFAHLDVAPAPAVVASLKALGNAMVETSFDATGDSTIPVIYTYWGQFVDHDLTANTDREQDIGITDGILDPLPPRQVLRDLRNLREPQLNLDSLYGKGPIDDPTETAEERRLRVPFVDDASFELGGLTPVGGVQVPGADLPRTPEGTARVGDGRNDENLIIAQLQSAMLRFHNAVVEAIGDGSGVELQADDVPAFGYSERFWKARRLVQWHYQWATVHDFLKRVVDPGIVDELLDDGTERLFTPTDERSTYMPLEFSIAAFRFGHSMVRARYDWNDNFGHPNTDDTASPFGPFADFDALFAFTGNGRLLTGQPGNGKLPSNWPARFERLTGAEGSAADIEVVNPDGTTRTVSFPSRFARKIDPFLAPPLSELLNQGNDPEASERIRRILKRLAVRNLLRGYRLALPTGQAVANALGIAPLTHRQLLEGAPKLAADGTPLPHDPDAVHDALVDGNFLDRTPLWFYVLREAEVLEGGERLGPVGGRIVAETILGQLRADPRSFLNADWEPKDGVALDDGTSVDSIITILRFAGVHPPFV